MESEYAYGGPPTLLTMQETLSDFGETAGREVLNLGKNARARGFGKGDRPGQTLARTSGAYSDRSRVTCVMSSSGEMTTDPVSILDTFRAFYERL